MELYRREKYLRRIRGFYHADDLIKVITGVRRCGKSTLMATIAEELSAFGVTGKQIIYFDLDRRDNQHIRTAESLEKAILEASKTKKLKYLFLDEIQNVQGFEVVLNGFREEGGYSIFVTGSNSYLLSGELMTKLTGRYLSFEIFPLSFEEYEEMKKLYQKPVLPDLMAELNAYIMEGGFPRTVQIDDLEDKRTYVQGIVSEIFEKDIRRRVRIRDVAAFDAVRHFIINNFGATTSINRMQQSLERNGTRISRRTLARYIEVLTDAKILCPCDRFDMKSERALAGEKKYYLSDLSFYFSQNTDNRINYGPVLENLVYIYARSLAYAVSIGRIGKLECDFILRNTEQEYAYVQVAYTILASQETEEREYRPLESIRDNYAKYVLTMDALRQQRKGIRHANLAEFIGNRKGSEKEKQEAAVTKYSRSRFFCMHEAKEKGRTPRRSPAYRHTVGMYFPNL